jgi:IS30 family transposase
LQIHTILEKEVSIAAANRENTNGLIRQYIPPKSNFNDFSKENIDEIQQKLNNRPRKTLEFDSPIQNLTKNKIAFQS